MSDINILANGIIQGEEIPSEASQISYSGKVNASNVKDALDKLQTELADKPIIENLDKVAFTGNYNDLKNLPNIPSQISDLVNDKQYVDINTLDLTNYYLKQDVYTKEQVDDLLAAAKDNIYILADEQPTENISSSVIYIIKEDENIYKKYIYLKEEEKWIPFNESMLDIKVDQVINNKTQTSSNPISTKGVYDYLKTHLLTTLGYVDSESTSPVESQAIYKFVTKLISDQGLQPVAFSGSYLDLVDTPLDAGTLGPATEDELGLVKVDGTSIVVNEEGVLSQKKVIATEDSLGMVQPDGETLKIDEYGVLSLALDYAEEVEF